MSRSGIFRFLTSLARPFSLLSAAHPWRSRQQRVRELEEMLALQERKVQHLTRFAEQMQESEAGTRAIIDNALDGIITIDYLGRVMEFNPAAEQLFGYEREEVLGKPLVDLLVPPRLRHLQRRGWARFRATGEGPWIGHRIETIGLRADGREFPLELSITVLHPSQPPLLTAYLRDLTQLKQAALALERAKEAAEAANRAKSDFLANVSHEIRTPMNGILGMTQLALDTDLSAEQRDYLQMVKTSADGLLTVINDILDFSKIEAGKLELDPIDFELRDMLADAVRSLSVRANAKDLELACHVAADVPDFLVGDPVRLRQVLLNLVGNAIKFTERGEVVVRGQLADSSGERGRVSAPRACSLGALTQPRSPALQPGGDIDLHFSVSDTGIGIAPEKLPYIFDSFVQADTSTTRKYGGTGLGLTITSRLVEMMAGELWVESVPRQGSTFHFTLRLKLQDRAPSRLLPRRPLHLQGLTVLVVDDNTTNRQIVADLLSSWLMKPTTVSNARQALAELQAAAAAEEPFPLVLLDAHMPEEDGFALAAAVRSRPHLGAPELVLLLSANRPGDGEKCRQLGINQRLTKPIKPSDLLRAIVSVFDSASNGAPSEAASGPCAREPSRDALVEARPGSAIGRGLRVLLAEDNLVNRRLILAVLEKQGHHVVSVTNGAAAVRAVQQEAFDLVFMDVQMPEMNGLEATRAIRAWEQQCGGHVPIVAMTAHAMKGARDDCLRAGMDEYLSKPVQAAELLRVLGRGARFQRAGTVEPCPTTAARPAVFDPRPLMQRLSDDDELFRELVRLFQEDGPRLLETIRAAVESEDAESVERTAHLLKGSASNFAAAEVVQAAQRLENLGRNGDLHEARDAYRALEQSLSHFCGSLDEWLAVHPG